MRSIPETFARRMAALHGAAGGAWLERLPGLIADCERRWSLTVLPPFPDLSYNYVAPAIRADGANLVLKLGAPHYELLTEIAALRLYNGRGIARLLDADPDWGALLLERLSPGATLATLPDDEEATRVAARVMRRLWRPAPTEHPFPTVAKWAEGLNRLRAEFGGGTGPFPAALVERAERLFAELIPTQAAPALLHGDLHHFNILAAEREPWLALDPKGLVGEPAYEVGAFLRNPMPDLLAMPQPGRVIARRIAIFADELGFDPRRLHDWNLAQAVLSAWWSYEDGDDGWQGHMIAYMELLTTIEVR